MREMKVLILGTGLSSAFAVKACKDLGIKPEVMSDKPISYTAPGSIWLHGIPHTMLLPEPELLNVAVLSRGTKEVYLDKQWGEHKWDSSFPQGLHFEVGFRPEPYLRWMWEGVIPQVFPSPLHDKEIGYLADHYDFVFHSFPSQKSKINLNGWRVSIPIERLYATFITDFSILYPEITMIKGADAYEIYDGTENAWVRSFYNNNVLYREYPFTFDIPKGEEENFFPAFDIHPDCPEWHEKIAENVYPIGRFATWKRKYLAHESYSDVCSIIKSHTTE